MIARELFDSFDFATERNYCYEMSVFDAVLQGQELMQQGADVNEGADNGWTPLKIAADSGLMDTVRYLVEQGADIEKAGEDSQTPIMAVLGMVT